jgi:uncharacterized protein involved in outer membrane biogenesis
VNRVLKAILVICASLAVLLVAGALVLQAYVQRPATQARIESELSRALKVPLEITKTSVSPRGLRITGVTVPDGERTLLDAEAFSARYRFWPLLQGRLVVYEMLLENPKITWTQNAEGKWALPALPDAKEEKSEETPDEAPRKKSGFELLDHDGHRVATASGVEMAWSFERPEQVEGSFSAARLAWKDALIFSDVRTPLRYTAEGALTLPEIEAILANGAVRGNFSVETEAKDAPFALALSFDKVDLARLTTEAGWQPGQAAGALSGGLELRGNSSDIERAEGKGDLTLDNGQFRQLEFFQTIGQILQINELSNLRLKNARAQFHVADEKTFIDRVALETTDLQLSAKGVARFDGKLQLDAQLAVADRLGRQLPGFVRDNFNAPNDEGWRAIDFKISGRTDKPKYDLLDRIIGQRIGSQFEDLVSSIFGAGGKKEKKEKEKGEKKKKRDAAEDEPGAAEPATTESIREP